MTRHAEDDSTMTTIFLIQIKFNDFIPGPAARMRIGTIARATIEMARSRAC